MLQIDDQCAFNVQKFVTHFCLIWRKLCSIELKYFFRFFLQNSVIIIAKFVHTYDVIGTIVDKPEAEKIWKIFFHRFEVTNFCIDNCNFSVFLCNEFERMCAYVCAMCNTQIHLTLKERSRISCDIDTNTNLNETERKEKTILYNVNSSRTNTHTERERRCIQTTKRQSRKCRAFCAYFPKKGGKREKSLSLSLA